MITLYTLLILAAIAMQAFFTASEMSLTSVNRVKLKDLVDSGDKGALGLNSFLKKKGGFLGATLVGTNIAVVVSSVVATRIFAEYFGVGAAPLVATICMVPITLVFAEIAPKMIARQFAMPVALKAVGPLRTFQKIFYPLIVAVNFVARGLIMPFGKRLAPEDMTFSKSDLKKLLILGHETGEVEADEVELIHKVLDFGAKKLEKIMVPLYTVSSIRADDTVDNLKRLVAYTGYSRIPVYRKDKDNIIGIINIYDILFSEKEDGEEAFVEDFIREPVYLSRKDGLDIALARLRHKKQPMGIVVNDGEEVAGIVTIEDMLEEIVGEIEDR
ncbi:MAG: DUF21 domain-containing protein [Candidatus Omnitrophica bacterium]|nr:DUF21 domain-containing protein [Candidatus Omnitrophota bacterium]